MRCSKWVLSLVVFNEGEFPRNENADTVTGSFAVPSLPSLHYNLFSQPEKGSPAS